jgi:hypothetical protein
LDAVNTAAPFRSMTEFGLAWSPTRMSLRIAVPANVPSLTHGSSPWTPSFPAKSTDVPSGARFDMMVIECPGTRLRTRTVRIFAARRNAWGLDLRERIVAIETRLGTAPTRS